MSLEANTFTTDHRHPNLVHAGIGLVAIARHAAKACKHTTGQLVQIALDSLYSHDRGEHRDIICQAVSRKSGVPASILLRVYDSVDLSSAPRSAAQLDSYLNKDVDVESIISAVVRFETCHHIKLIYTFANRAAGKAERSPEELFFYGFIGLMNALRKYTPDTGTISTFAAFRINGSIRDGIRSESPVPKRLTTFARSVESAEEKLTHALSRVPSKAEVAAMLGSQSRYMHLYPRLAHQASLDEMENWYSPATEADACTEAVDNETRELVSNMMSRLPRFEARALQLHVMDAMSVRDAARSMGVSQRDFKELVAGGLATLRAEPALQDWVAA